MFPGKNLCNISSSRFSCNQYGPGTFHMQDIHQLRCRYGHVKMAVTPRQTTVLVMDSTSEKRYVITHDMCWSAFESRKTFDYDFQRNSDISCVMLPLRIYKVWKHRSHTESMSQMSAPLIEPSSRSLSYLQPVLICSTSTHPWLSLFGSDRARRFSN